MKGDAAFLVELGLLLTLLGAAGAIALKAGLSTVPLFLVAGLLIAEGSPVQVDSARPFLDAAAAVGIVLLMLALGLEFSTSEFASAIKKQAGSGVLDLALNATPGFLLGLALRWPWPACLALAGVTWVSSSGIVAKLLTDLNRLGNRETPAVLSLLVIEDVAMAVYLPILGVVLVGGELLTGSVRAAVAMAVVIALLLLARRFERVLERILLHDDSEQVMLRVLGLTLVVAGLTELLGISAAVGAFLVGVAIPAEAAKRARAVLEPLRDLFAAVFFLAFASLLDVQQVPGVLPVAVLLAAVTLVTKVVTGWYAARREGVAARGRMRAGTVLVARGEFSMVIAGLAVVAGFEELGTLATAYVLILAVVGPLLTRFADSLAGPWVRRDAVRAGSR